MRFNYPTHLGKLNSRFLISGIPVDPTGAYHLDSQIRHPVSASPVMVSVFNETTDQSRDASITAELDIFTDQPGFPMARNGEVVFPKAEPVDRKSALVKKVNSRRYY